MKQLTKKDIVEGNHIFVFDFYQQRYTLVEIITVDNDGVLLQDVDITSDDMDNEWEETIHELTTNNKEYCKLPHQMDETRMDQLAKMAEDSFWETVSAGCPEIKTGDFPPDAAMAIHIAMCEAIKVWYEGNKETENERT